MFCYVLHSRTRSRPVDDYYFGQVFLLLFQVASAICRLNSFTIDTKSRWAHCCGSRLERIISGSVNVNCLPLKPQHMCCLQELSVSTAAARLLPSSRSRDFVCQCGPSRKEGGVAFSSSWCRTHPPKGRNNQQPPKNQKDQHYHIWSSDAYIHAGSHAGVKQRQQRHRLAWLPIFSPLLFYM